MNIHLKGLTLLLVGLVYGLAQSAVACPADTTPDSAKKATVDKPQRTTVTGSNISRVRTADGSQSLLVLDEGYIQQSGATNSPELIRTVPQTQNGGISGSSPQRH